HTFSSTCSSTGSLTMPPSGEVTSMYLPCLTAHLVRSRQGNMSISMSGAGPLPCTVRSTPTSHSVTPSCSALYSTETSSYSAGSDILLEKSHSLLLARRDR